MARAPGAPHELLRVIAATIEGLCVIWSLGVPHDVVPQLPQGIKWAEKHGRAIWRQWQVVLPQNSFG